MTQFTPLRPVRTSLLLVCMLLFTGIAPGASAHSSGVEVNYWDTWNTKQTHLAGPTNWYAQGFKIGDGVDGGLESIEVTNFYVWMGRITSVSETVCVRVYNYGSYGSALASGCKTLPQLGSSLGWQLFDMGGVVLSGSTPYAFRVEYLGNCYGCLEVGTDDYDTYRNGDSQATFATVTGTSRTHTNNAHYDIMFMINGKHNPYISWAGATTSITSTVSATVGATLNDDGGAATQVNAKLYQGGSLIDTTTHVSCAVGSTCTRTFDGLRQNTAYQTEVCATNSALTTCLDKRSFTTGNVAPTKAGAPSGAPALIGAGPVTLSTSATDVYDSIQFEWDWGGTTELLPATPILTGSVPVTHNAQHAFDTSGVLDLRVRARDPVVAGPWSDTVQVTVDADAPLAPSLATNVATGVWTQHTGDITFDWHVEDPTVNGVTSQAQSRFNDGSGWTSWTALGAAADLSHSVPVSDGPGSFVVEVRDGAGNTVAQSLTYMVDNTAPTAATVFVSEGTSGTNGWHTTPVTLDVAASDPTGGSGIACTRIADAATGPWTGGCLTDGLVVPYEGLTTWYGHATDGAGNEHTAPTGFEVRIDLADPVIDDLTPAVVPWTSDPADLVFDVDFGDATSGLRMLEYRILESDGSVAKGWTTISQFQSTGVSSYVTDWGIDHTALVQGSNHLDVRATDFAGRTTTLADVVEIQWDTVVPSKATPTVDAGSPGGNGWYLTDVDLSIDSADATSGVATESHRLGIDGTWVAGGAQDQWTDNIEGAKTWYGRAQDNAGNTHVSSPVEVKVDKTDPSIDAVLNGPIGNDGWFIGTVTATLTAVDAESGLSDVAYRIDSGPWTAVTGGSQNVVVSGQGSHELRHYAVDAAGRQDGSAAAPNLATFRIDSSAPISTATVDGVPGTAGTYLSAVTVTIDATDATSGVAGMYVDDGINGLRHFETDQVVLEFTDAGSYLVQYWAVDNAGLSEADTASAHQVSFQIDLAPPSTTILPSGTQGARGWFTTPVDFAFSATDDQSGVSVTNYGVDDAGTPSAYSTPFRVSKEGNTAIYYRSTDVAGRVETVKTFALKIDTDGTEFSNWNAAPFDLDTSHDGPLVVSVDADPGASGVHAMDLRYSYDGGTSWSGWNPMTAQTAARYQADVPEPAQGWWYYSGLFLKYQVRATDGAGHVDVSPERSEKIDQTAPTVTLLSPTRDEAWGNGVRDVLWRGQDHDHHVVTYRFYLSNDGGFTFPSTPLKTVVVAEDGNLNTHSFPLDTRNFADGDRYALKVQADDGYVTATDESGPFIMDNSKPTVQMTNPSRGSINVGGVAVDHVDSTSTVVVGTVPLEVDARDMLSGIDRVEFRVDGVLIAIDTLPEEGSLYTTNWDSTQAGLGDHDVCAYGFDNAGNSDFFCRTLTVVVDI